MNRCLIFPYGGTTKWLDLSLRNYPDISWVILVADSNQRTPDEPNRVEDCKKYVSNLQSLESQLPQPIQRKYDIIEVPEFDYFYQNLAFFRSLIQYIHSHDYSDIMIHQYRDWETDRKSTRLNSSHSAKSRMPSSA